MRRVYVCVLVIAAALSGCAQDTYYRSSSNTASPSQSGVTVYGEIDTSVGRVR